MSICLTHEEIVEVTDKIKYSAQIRVLRALGIESRQRPDGSIIVDRAHYAEWARGTVGAQRKTQEKTQPRWDA